ncbi:MAG: succinylglutamate desuccinylase/aspartoacylase family protein [Oligoflexales bacterium]|nr:succinylglutamate desuccinylase/aspartoacylase family protein [Oligoflexales bacterium]
MTFLSTMKIVSSKIILPFYALLFFSACGGPFDNDGKFHSFSGITGASYATISRDLKNLAHNNGLVEISNYGNTALGQELIFLRIGQNIAVNTFTNKRPVIFISGATHGDEYLGIEDQLADAISNAYQNKTQIGLVDFIDKGGLYYIVPILNPDGYTKKQRRNLAGFDLNRDFPLKRKNHKGLSQIETRTLSHFLTQKLKLDHAELAMTFDYHCCYSNSAAALVYPWGYSMNQKERYIALEKHKLAKKVGELAKKHISKMEYGNVIDILQYPAIGASDDSHFENFFEAKPDHEFGLSFTFEGQRLSSGINPNTLTSHLAMWNEISAYVSSF